MSHRLLILALCGGGLLFGDPVFAGTIRGRVTIPRSRALADIVVYVDKAPGRVPPPKQHVVMDQKNLAFVPRVLPVVAGTTVDFLNSDQVLHNVFTPDACAGKFDLGTWPNGEVRSVLFDELGCSLVVLCKMHPEMEGFIVVLQNPFFAVTDSTGLYAIADVPAGDYTLKVWNRKPLDIAQDVVVPKQGDVIIDLALK